MTLCVRRLRLCGFYLAAQRFIPMLLAVFIDSLFPLLKIGFGGDSDLDIGQLFLVGIGFEVGLSV